MLSWGGAALISDQIIPRDRTELVFATSRFSLCAVLEPATVSTDSYPGRNQGISVVGECVQ